MKLWSSVKRLVQVHVVLCLMLVMPVQAFAQNSMNEVYEILLETHISAPSEEELSRAAIEGMVQSLGDPYTQYFSPEELESFNNALDQVYIGVGIRLDEAGNFYSIAEIFPGSDAREKDVQVGDVIVGIDGQDVESWDLEQITNAIKGEEGTAVQLTLQRGNQTFDVELVRKQVSIPVVQTKRFDDETAYIQLSSFSSDSGPSMKNAIAELEQEGLNTLILDLRDNPGGYLQSANQIAAMFMDRGILIYERNNEGMEYPMFFKGGEVPSYELIVLVNENSASASEVLSGALQDHEAATLVGTQTFGKGSVQSIYSLDNGGAIKVTIEEYLTPKKHVVNGVGITPDVVVAGEIPQLLTALHEADAAQIDVQFEQNSTKIGQAQFDVGVQVHYGENGTYVSSRVLSALVNASISWDAETKTIIMETEDQSHSWNVAHDAVRIEAGVSMIELSSFQEAFPSITWSTDGNMLNMTYTKGNN